MADRLAENGAIQYALANPEAGSKRAALSGYIMGALEDWLKNPFPPSSRLAAPGRLRGKFFDSGIAPLAMDFTSNKYASGSAGTMAMKSFSDIVTFSRTSNATITKSDGTIGYAPHNLLTYSEQFDNAAWVKSGLTVTANITTSPNSTSTADVIIESNTNVVHQIYENITIPSGVVTYSVYAKQGTGSRYLTVYPQCTSVGWAIFNLSTGVKTANGGAGYVSSSITDVGNGWYRCSVTLNATGTSLFAVCYLTNSTTVPADAYAGDGSSSIYIWGAQLEIGSTATTYNPTTVKNLLGYTEAFDNAAWTKSNSFVQTNLLTYSEAFDNAAWVKTTITATANSIIAPNGYQTADTLAATGANSTALQTFTASAVPYTYSVYLYRKTGTGNIDITVDGTTWVTKTITVGWTRVDTTLTPAAGSKTSGIRIATNGDEIYAWGAQLVQGSVAGDYRRTDSASLPVFYPNHNGVVCAEKLVENTATNYHAIYGTTITAGTYMASIYAKAGEKQFLQLAGGSSVNDYITFNLTLGTITQTGSGATLGSITAAGNGYYRCSARIPLGVTGVFIAACSTGTGGWLPSNAGDGTSGIYIFGAQLSDSASLDPYVLNAAAAPSAQAYYGARFDYDPVTLAPKGLLIEEQRVNLILQSEAFDNATWNAFGTKTVIPDAAISPAGTITADYLASPDNNGVQQGATISASTTYTFSVYVKAGAGSSVRLSYATVGGTVVSGSTDVVINTGTLVANGFYRISNTFTTGVGNTSVVVRIQTATTPGIYIWGAQLEAGAFATSYIPTAASTVTRAADVAVIQGSNFYSWYNQNEGSILYSTLLQAKPALSALGIYSIDDGTTNNAYPSFYDASIYINSRVNGSGVFSSTSSFAVASSLTLYKQMLSYKIADYASYINGGQVSTQSSGAIPLVNRMQIGVYNSKYINSPIKQISYYNTRLANATLQGLTA